MSGIYIHIPFCKQACSYCDFHFATSLRYKDDMILAIKKEMELAQDFIEDKSIQTVYFGGGTPSLLSADEISKMIDHMSQFYDLHSVTEWTLEANPDDLNNEYLKSLKQYTPIDRLSIGIQSLQQNDLKIMNRAHDVAQAKYCIPAAQDAGFERLSCDLIFGTPSLTSQDLIENMDFLIHNQVPHISAYALTIEDNTPLYKKIKNAEFTVASDTHYETQMLLMMQHLTDNGYNQYEISNYALEGLHAQHNTNYWRQIPYYGFGPSAHAYNGQIRRWNVRNNQRYIDSLLHQKEIPYEEEFLTLKDQINEYIMTSLRTMWGIPLSSYTEKFGITEFNRLMHEAQPLIEQEYLSTNDNHLVLTRPAKIISDSIMCQLFV